MIAMFWCGWIDAVHLLLAATKRYEWYVNRIWAVRGTQSRECQDFLGIIPGGGGGVKTEAGSRGNVS